MHEEHDLIRRAQELEPSAFGEIYERYHNGVYKYIYYRVGDQTLAEDLTMEVFVKAIEAIDTYNYRGVPFSAWLYRIGSNLVIDHFRRQPNRPALALEEKLVATNGDGSSEKLENEFSHQELRFALSELTDDQQQVIVLKFVDGLSNYEVAQILGKTEGAVKSLQHRALASLGRVLGERGEVPA